MKDFIVTQQFKLKNLFEDDAQYKIPKFQREYAWSEDEIEAFWKDLINHYKRDDKTPYFFGSIVLIDSDPKKEEYKVVDGQQRLSTSMILLSIIRDMLDEYNDTDNANIVEGSIKIQDYDGDANYPYRLELSRNNQNFFKEFILIREKIFQKSKKNSENINVQDKNLSDAYKLLIKKITEELATKSNTKDKIHFLVKLVTHFMRYFMVIRNVIDTPDRAYRIFDSINNRGIDLTESDLVKNYLLEIIDHNNGKIDKWYDKWLEILKILNSDTSKRIIKENDFLRHFLMAHHKETDPEKVFETIHSGIKTLDNAEKFIECLYKDAKIYRKLKSPDKSDWSGDGKIIEEIVTGLEVFNDLGFKVVYPVLLLGYANFSHDQKIFLEFIKMLLIFFFRSKTICKTSAMALESLVNKVCSNIRGASSLTVHEVGYPPQTIQQITDTLKKPDKEYKSDEEFIYSFKNYSANQKNAFYILNNLNIALRGGLEEMTLTANKNNVSVEHIMPKTFKNTDWETMLKKSSGTDNENEIKNRHKAYLWKIGNLTLLGKNQNSKLKNKPYSEKLEQLYRTDDAKITQDLDKWKTWDMETMKERQKKLADTAVSIWSL